MTRRDYEIIAQALKVARPHQPADPYENHQHLRVCHVIAGTLKADNPAFDYDLFMRNTGMA
jgi:hypothetical protein